MLPLPTTDDADEEKGTSGIARSAPVGSRNDDRRLPLPPLELPRGSLPLPQEGDWPSNAIPDDRDSRRLRSESADVIDVMESLIDDRSDDVVEADDDAVAAADAAADDVAEKAENVVDSDEKDDPDGRFFLRASRNCFVMTLASFFSRFFSVDRSR